MRGERDQRVRIGGADLAQGRRIVAQQVADQAPDQVEVERLHLLGQRATVVLGQALEHLGQVRLAGRPQALVEAHAEGRRATLVTPSTRSAISR